MTDPAKMGTLDGEQFERRRQPIGRLIFWIRSKLVQDVPDALAECEFDCHRPDCTRREWEKCSIRVEAPRR